MLSKLGLVVKLSVCVFFVCFLASITTRCFEGIDVDDLTLFRKRIKRLNYYNNNYNKNNYDKYKTKLV